MLPPNESYKSLVNFESLYGICTFFLETKADMTFPNVDKDKLMAFASFNLWSFAYVFDYLSEPAKSTKFNLLFLIVSIFLFF